ncbi:MAG: hypothetical protein C5B52_17410 [Bacteroidetes bacterium]|nr:MAG: hypothetical protein C5B52_17410 [Bacteroidota bacterium]
MAIAKPRNDGYPYQYAAKFICTANLPGTSQTDPAVLPGIYQTAVNIHNPQARVVKIRKKIASVAGISQFISSEIKPDGVETVVCADVEKFGLHLIHGFEGFLVVESVASIDVVAVYTAGERGGQVTGIDVEQIKERKF